MNIDKIKIGFIGVGYMGFGMALNLLKNNYDLFVIAHKNRKHIDSLIKKGAKESLNLIELASSTNVIMMCVTNTPVALEIIDQLSPYLQKKVAPQPYFHFGMRHEAP